MIVDSLQTLGCRPIASLDHFLPEHLGSADLVEEVSVGNSKVVKVSAVCACVHACICVYVCVWGGGVWVGGWC